MCIPNIYFVGHSVTSSESITNERRNMGNEILDTNFRHSPPTSLALLSHCSMTKHDCIIHHLLHIMCGYQCDIAVNENDT